METRGAILNLEYSEKMKSGLIIGAGLLDQLISRSSFSEAISLATTVCQRSMNFLTEKKLL